MNCAECSYSDSLYPTAPGPSGAIAVVTFGEQLMPVWSGAIGSSITRIMSHVKHHFEHLPDFLKQNRRYCDEGGALQLLDAAEWPAELEKTYAMAETRAVIQRPNSRERNHIFQE